MKTAFFDTKSYDRDYFTNFSDHKKLGLTFFDCRLTTETASLAKGYNAVCVFVNDSIDRPCIQQLSEMGVKHIALRCAGYNNVDTEAAAEHGMIVTRVPAYSPYAVAEHTIALLLTLNRHIHRAYNRVREHNFSLAGLVGFDLHGKTAGVIGAGKIGRLTASLLRSFGCHVLAHDLAIDESWATKEGVTPTSLSNLLKKSDIITLHLPLTPETYHLIDSSAFNEMKRGSILINTGRGKLIDTTALIHALKSGQIGGVALDVYEEEEGVFFEDLSNSILQDDELSRLLTFPNVLITSHQAFLTKEALSEIAATTCQNLIYINKGHVPKEGTQVT